MDPKHRRRATPLGSQPGWREDGELASDEPR